MTVSDWVFGALLATALVSLVLILLSQSHMCIKLAESFDKQQAINADFDKRLRGHWANIVTLQQAVIKVAGEIDRINGNTKTEEGVKNGE